MISFRIFCRKTAALCAIMAAGATFAGDADGVARMSDHPSPGSPSAGQQTNFFSGDSCGNSCGESCYIPQPCPSECCPPMYCPPGYTMDGCNQGCDPCNYAMYGAGTCDSGMCQSGSCYTATDCNDCFSGHDAHGRRRGHNRGWGNDCQNCNDSWSNGGGRGRVRGHGRGQDDCQGGRPRGFWQRCNNANCCVADTLFGWMIPAGCNGQGAPWVGKYHMTYADRPAYVDPRDTRLYAAQGYGMPITVPLAPNVNHAYNYSSGIPASRVTTIGTYNPMTSPRPLNCQSW